MNSNHQLIVARTHDEFMERYQFFMNGERTETEEITNEQMAALEKEKVNQQFSEMLFGGQGGSLDEWISMYADQLEEAKPRFEDKVLQMDDLKTETEDPFHVKEYKERTSVVFAQIDDPVRDPLTSTYRKPESSTTNQYVRSSGFGAATAGTGGVGYNSGYNSTGTTSAVGPKPGERADALEHAGRMMQNTMDVAIKNKQAEEEKRTGFKAKSWWGKAKAWVKSKEGRIVVKTGLLMALQLGIAFFGGKYEYKGLAQAAGLLGLLIGVFVVTRELGKEGFDPRGLGI